MAVPIWKDYFVTLGTTDGTLFRIRIGSYSGDIIYSGKAYLRPGETDNVIRINEICADYLTHALPTMERGWSPLTLPTFYVQASTDGGTTWANKGSVQFTKDWSYDDSFNPATMPFSQPVNGRIDARQLLLYSALNISQVAAVLTFQDGSTMTVYVPVARHNSFDASFDASFEQSILAAQSATAVLDLSGFTGLKSVRVANKKTYTVAGDCFRHVLYYVNEFGGWDSLLIEGASRRTDAVSRRTIGVDYDNRDGSARGTFDYLNEVVPRWTLCTGRMSDAEAEAMPGLFNSPEVYLMDLASRRVLPVVLSDAEQTIRRTRNGGPIFFEITATLAQDRIRR